MENEKTYTPHEVAIKVADKIKELYKNSKLSKSNTAHEIEEGQEAINDEAECPESVQHDGSKPEDEKDGKRAKNKKKEGDKEGSEKDKEGGHPQGETEEQHEGHGSKETSKEEDGEHKGKKKEDNEEEGEESEDDEGGENKKKIIAKVAEKNNKEDFEKAEKTLKLKDFLEKREEKLLEEFEELCKSDPSAVLPKDSWDKEYAKIKAANPKLNPKRIKKIIHLNRYKKIGRKQRTKVKKQIPTVKKDESRAGDPMEKFLGTSAPAAGKLAAPSKAKQPTQIKPPALPKIPKPPKANAGF